VTGDRPPTELERNRLETLWPGVEVEVWGKVARFRNEGKRGKR
jgi:hypothetical protein